MSLFIRFWWQRKGVFSGAQRTALQGVSLSRIICDNTHIRLVPPDPFTRTRHTEDLLPCAHPLIPPLNLSAWREPDTGRPRATEPPSSHFTQSHEENPLLQKIDFITFGQRNGFPEISKISTESWAVYRHIEFYSMWWFTLYIICVYGKYPVICVPRACLSYMSLFPTPSDPICGSIPRVHPGYSLLCDSVILYHCPVGFILVGPSQVKCDPHTQQWTPAPPTCQGNSLQGHEEIDR